LQAFEDAIFDPNTGSLLDPVVVAEMQALGGDQCDISLAADNAFDCGAVVIAAQGNRDEVSDHKVACPARAHWAIGVGAFAVTDAGNPPTPVAQCAGPTDDQRVEPDIITPTNTLTAGDHETLSGCKVDDDRAFNPLTATSGATPYAAGAAALWQFAFA